MCNGHPCRDCSNTIKHGESWCVYDGITSPGYSLVGSRHFLHSCIDGKEYIEECRDFREELCTEGTIYPNGRSKPGLNKGVCRTNRWNDCVLQSNSACIDSSERDCYWVDWTFSTQGEKEGECIPRIPPGFRFWYGEDETICDLANDYGPCPMHNITCPWGWVYTSSNYCYFMGDCGNWRNIADELTTGGYLNMQLTLMGQTENPRVSSPVYDRLNSNYRLTLPLDGYDPQYATYHPKTEADMQEYEDEYKMLMYKQYNKDVSPCPSKSKVCNLFECGTGVNSCQLENPIDQHFKAYVIGKASCDVWQAPDGGDCTLCEKDPQKVCSEYRCRSLGRNCYYEEVSGVGHCNKILEQGVDYDTKPTVDLIEESVKPLTPVQSTFTTSSGTVSIQNGYEIRDQIAPYSTFNFNLSTDRITQCKVNIAPGFGYNKNAFMPAGFQAL
jgi:hypothetical protein